MNIIIKHLRKNLTNNSTQNNNDTRKQKKNDNPITSETVITRETSSTHWKNNIIIGENSDLRFLKIKPENYL